MNQLYELGMYMINQHYENTIPITDETLDAEMTSFQEELIDSVFGNIDQLRLEV